MCRFMKAECEECDATYEDSPSKIERGKHNFCGKECYWSFLSSPLIEVVCENCGTCLTRSKSFAEQNEKNFCDKSCTFEYRRKTERWTSVGRPREKYICNFCSKEFLRQPSRAEQSEYNFCSRECKDQWHGTVYSQENHPGWKGGNEQKLCEICGEEYGVPKHRYDESRFCSYVCLGQANKKYRSGSDSPCWKKGASRDYGTNWVKQRKKALKRDNEKCQICFLSRKVHRERYDRDLEVHHIQPIRTFEDKNKGNKLSNLATLCRSHHTALHGKHLKEGFNIAI